MKRTTLFLPEGLHEELREEAFRTRVSMSEVMRKRLEKRTLPPPMENDPLLEVAGICGGGDSLTENLDEELYDL
jgi:hypothetical protein